MLIEPPCPGCGASAQEAMTLYEFGDFLKTLACSECGVWWRMVRGPRSDWQIEVAGA